MTIDQCNSALRILEYGIAQEAQVVMSQYIADNVGKVGDMNYSTGKLEQSIRVVSQNGVYYVGSNLRYAKFVDRGRGDVYPVNKDWLVFRTPDGRKVRTKHAKPMKGIHFIDATKRAMRGRTRIVWQRIIERSGA